MLRFKRAGLETADVYGVFCGWSRYLADYRSLEKHAPNCVAVMSPEKGLCDGSLEVRVRTRNRVGSAAASTRVLSFGSEFALARDTKVGAHAREEISRCLGEVFQGQGRLIQSHVS